MSKVLIACEFSGIVRSEFNKLGYDAVSIDLLDTEIPGNHIKGGLFKHLEKHSQNYKMMIAFPPCTHLATSGARWFKYKQKEQLNALKFVYRLLHADIQYIALENPLGVISTRIRKPDQIIQPWQFGHGETKRTCLWLKNLPQLKYTNIVDGRDPVIWKMAPSPDRAKNRSRTYKGIAKAMAQQWGVYLEQ